MAWYMKFKIRLLKLTKMSRLNSPTVIQNQAKHLLQKHNTETLLSKPPLSMMIMKKVPITLIPTVEARKV